MTPTTGTISIFVAHVCRCGLSSMVAKTCMTSQQPFGHCDKWVHSYTNNSFIALQTASPDTIHVTLMSIINILRRKGNILYSTSTPDPLFLRTPDNKRSQKPLHFPSVNIINLPISPRRRKRVARFYWKKFWRHCRKRLPWRSLIKTDWLYQRNYN